MKLNSYHSIHQVGFSSLYLAHNIMFVLHVSNLKENQYD
jgi:hypothetical protein